MLKGCIVRGCPADPVHMGRVTITVGSPPGSSVTITTDGGLCDTHGEMMRLPDPDAQPRPTIRYNRPPTRVDEGLVFEARAEDLLPGDRIMDRLGDSWWDLDGREIDAHLFLTVVSCAHVGESVVIGLVSDDLERRHTVGWDPGWKVLRERKAGE